MVEKRSEPMLVGDAYIGQLVAKSREVFTMNKYRFSYTQKYALWRAYEMECFYCERPLDFKNVTIDHIVPEYLLGEPVVLSKIITEYEINECLLDFSINDFGNWVPTDGPGCNFRKGETLLPKKVTLFFLSQIQKKLPKVREELARLARNRKQGKVLGDLSIALETNIISENNVIELLEDLEFERTHQEPLVITLGLLIETVLSTRQLGENVITDYAHLCDWLEEELVSNVRSLSTYSFHYTEPSSRTGDSLSVSLVFPELSLDEIGNLKWDEIEKSIPWWETLGVTNFYRVYGVTYQEAYNQS